MDVELLPTRTPFVPSPESLIGEGFSDLLVATHGRSETPGRLGPTITPS